MVGPEDTRDLRQTEIFSIGKHRESYIHVHLEGGS